MRTNGENAAHSRTILEDVLGARLFAEMLECRFRLPRDETRHVYFIGGPDGPVKIGYAKRLTHRLAMLIKEHDTPLAILATTPGGIDLESTYHMKFERHRLHGEWFSRSSEIEAEMTCLTSLSGAK